MINMTKKSKNKFYFEGEDIVDILKKFEEAEKECRDGKTIPFERVLKKFGFEDI